MDQHSPGFAGLALAIEATIDAWRAGDIDGALLSLDRARQQAMDWGDPEVISRLSFLREHIEGGRTPDDFVEP